MRETNITDAMLRAWRPPAQGRDVVRDAKVRALEARQTASGTISWSLARVRTRDGRQTRPRVGTWPAMGVAEARRRALAMLAEVQSGGDPVARNRKERAARTAPTVSERLAQWQAAMASRWSDTYRYDISLRCNAEIEPKLGTEILAEVGRETWMALIAEKRKKSESAGANLYRTVSSFLGYAEVNGWVPGGLLPRKGQATVAPAVAPRERALTDAELTAVWQAAEAEALRQRAFVQLLVLTAARRSEVAGIAASEIDLDARRWTIPATRAKNNQSLTVPLCELGLTALRAVWPNDPAFTGRLLGDGDGGLSGFSSLLARISKVSGVSDWSWHDLRRTARTGMARLGVPREAAEAALNHVSGRSRLDRTYDRHNYRAEVIDALSIWQRHVAELVSDTGGADIVSFRGCRHGPRT